MEGDFIRTNKWLLPLSWLYGLGVKLRNTMFDIGILKSRAFDVPVISVGNITVGGTGKTPHVEYLIAMMKDRFRVAVLSRGYKRKSKGFVLADADTPMQDIGDEPWQMKHKYPDVTVAVDKSRCHGIDMLLDGDKQLDAILLDDAFQHRYVKPGINILLVDYHRLIVYDKLLPAGRLREPLNGKDRADIVIVTKCPKDLKPMEFRVINKVMDLYPYQQLYFTCLEYGDLHPILSNESAPLPLDQLRGLHTVVLSGIASPEQMIHDLSPFCDLLTPLTFSDHHRFTPKDVQLINDTFDSLPSPKCIITTEKDKARLNNLEGLSMSVRNNIFVLPVMIHFMQDQQDTFNNHIIDYVHKNSRNSILAQSPDEEQPNDCNCVGNRPRTISFRNN
jgi:tetraacyldisaccharide 4'-kinase